VRSRSRSSRISVRRLRGVLRDRGPRSRQEQDAVTRIARDSGKSLRIDVAPWWKGSAEDIVASLTAVAHYLVDEDHRSVDGCDGARKGTELDYGLSFRAETVAGRYPKSAHRRDTSANRKVKWFNASKGFGFIQADERLERRLVTSRPVEKAGLPP